MKALGYDKRKLQAFIEIFDNFLGSVREPLVVLDSDLKVVKANNRGYRSAKETDDCLVVTAGVPVRKPGTTKILKVIEIE